MFKKTAVLSLPLKTIRWASKDIYKNKPEMKKLAEESVQEFYNKNERNMETRGISDAEFR